MRFPRPVAAIAVLLSAGAVHAGLYYSGESYAELPSQWRGVLLDQRTLRQIAVPETPKTPASPARVRYLEEKDKLEKKLAAGPVGGGGGARPRADHCLPRGPAEP